MNKFIREKKFKMYCSKHPWDIYSDIAGYLADSLRGYIKYLEMPNFVPVLTNESSLKLEELKAIQYAFNEIYHDYPDSPYNIWWNEIYDESYWFRIIRRRGYVDNTSMPKIPDEVKTAQEEYTKKILDTIKLYAQYAADINFEEWTSLPYICVTLGKKWRWHQLKKLHAAHNYKYMVFMNNQAQYIYECLVAFKKSKRYGSAGELSREEWEDTIDAMIFAFKKISEMDSEEYFAHELDEQVKEGLRLFGEYFLDLWD